MTDTTTQITTKTNRVCIDLKEGSVVIESGTVSLNECCKKAEAIAKKLTSNANPAEWGIT